MKRILISGIPASGKTTLAEYFATQGFYHVDMERDDFKAGYEYLNNRDKFLGRLAVHEDVVISWGFVPHLYRKSVEHLLENEYTLVWLDGDRVSSFREFMKREENDPISESRYHRQMEMIIVSGIIDAFEPVIVNPFNKNGQFRPIDTIAQEVLERLP